MYLLADISYSSACVASILRTIYSWKVYKKEDSSRNLGILGMWAHAEIAIGIIVSCMPVLPKFFQHFAPIIRHSLSYVSKAGSKVKPRSLFSGSTAREKQSSKGSDTFASRSTVRGDRDSWINHISLKTLTTGDYITLDDYDIPPQVPPKAHQVDKAVEPQKTGRQTLGVATLRDDLEMGHGNG